jgi:hypothetical protein
MALAVSGERAMTVRVARDSANLWSPSRVASESRIGYADLASPARSLAALIARSEDQPSRTRVVIMANSAK